MKQQSPPQTKAAKSLPSAKKSNPTKETPRWLAINLHREDADAWDRATKPTDLLILEYGVDVLRRIVSMPLQSQPEIYEMPRHPGQEWPGDLRTLSLDDSLGRSIVKIAESLEVSPEDWAYSAILAETNDFRTSKVTATKKAGSPRHRAEKLGNRLGLPADDILNMITRAGLEAMAEAFDRDDEITIPLRFHMQTRDTLPVHLPAGEVQFLRELCQAADIEAGADWMIEDMVSSIARDSLHSKTPSLNGAPDIIASMWDLRAEELAAMQTVVDRWNAGDGCGKITSEEAPHQTTARFGAVKGGDS